MEIIIWEIEDASPRISYMDYLFRHKAIALELYLTLFPDNDKIDYLLFHDGEIGIFLN